MMQLDLLRHGETELSHTLRGSIDDALTPKGWQQMQRTVDLVENADWDVIISSPLQRCLHFAEHMQKQLQCLLWIDAGLKEMNFGDWEGKTTQWIYEHHPEELAKFWETPTCYTPPDAEPITDFHQRIEKSHIEIQQRMQQHQFKKALVITHGGVIKMFKLMALKQPLDDILKMSAELGQLVSFKMHEQTQIIWEPQQ